MEVMIVEDDQDDVELYQEVIYEADKNAEIQYAVNGNEALALLRSGNYWPDLVILDYNLPKMNGLDFLKTVNIKRPFCGGHINGMHRHATIPVSEC